MKLYKTQKNMWRIWNRMTENSEEDSNNYA